MLFSDLQFTWITFCTVVCKIMLLPWMEPIQFESWEVLISKNGLRQYSNKSIVEVEMTLAEKVKESNISSNVFPYTCRACLNRGELIPILDSYVKQNDSEIQVGQLLKDCVRIEVTERDGLPQNICMNCLRKLMKIYNFCERCCLSERTLKSARNLSQVSEDDSQKTNSDFQQEKDTLNDLLFKKDNSTIELRKDLKHRRISDTVRKLTVRLNDSKESSPTKSIEERGPARSNKETEQEDKNFKPSNLNNSAKRSNEKPEEVEDCLKFIFKCKFCEVTCNSVAELQAHRKELHHSRKLYQKCEVCHKMIHIYFMKKHMFTHAEEKPYKCDHCDKDFAYRSNFRRHLRIHTGEKPYMCELCGRAFIQFRSLQEHKNNHDKIRPSFSVSEDPSLPYRYFCGPCGMPIKNLAGYQTHMRKHDPNNQEAKTFICEKCGKSYRREASLNNHKRVHCDGPFICIYCGKNFSTKVSLQVHHRKHTGERPYSCWICNQRFSKASVLEIHMRLHTGYKPFACDVCKKTFVQRHHLVNHMRTHSGEKPYVCDQCGKAFTHNGNLTVHIRRHNKDTPYICEICGKGFYDSTNRKRHQKIKHKIEQPDSQEVSNEKCLTENQLDTENIFVGSEYYTMSELLFDSS